MNPHLEQLQAYPFERMNALKAGVSGNPEFDHVSLSLGEPQHAPPDFVVEMLADGRRLREGLGSYPTTRGSDVLRAAAAAWLSTRYGASVNNATQVLPVAGTREALFSFAQTILSRSPGSLCLLPNPFYQIYEGAAYLGGATPYFVNTSPANGYQPDYQSIPDDIWRRCELLFVCSPANPTGKVLPEAEMIWLLEQAQRFDFVIAADECYSEIYFDEAHPPGGFLSCASNAGLTNYPRLVVFHSLSKRSNLPGLRSGFVAGDARLLERYFQYRTYEGCALPTHIQAVSAAAWADETHVRANRALYREKFTAVTSILQATFHLDQPQGGFYHWLATGEDDQQFARRLFEQANITVLPGSFLSREAHGEVPGAGHVRVAWVAQLSACLDAARRLAAFAGANV